VRLVIDTNVLVSALVFKDSRHLPLREAWEAGRHQPLMSMATYRELKRVLCYPMFALDDDLIQSAIARIGPFFEWVDIDQLRVTELARCSDRDDQKFLELAVCGNADALLTYDKALLKMRRRPFSFLIAKPEQIEMQHQA
jgi:putative PIN family toxin of toxin-antitoxin system